MKSRRTVLGVLGGSVGVLGLVVAPLTPWFNYWQLFDFEDPVPLTITNHDPVDHTVEVTITNLRSGGTVFEETVDIEAATGEEVTSVEFEEVTSTVGEYRVTAELDTGVSGDMKLDPLDHGILNLAMPHELHITIGTGPLPGQKLWISEEGNPP